MISELSEVQKEYIKDIINNVDVVEDNDRPLFVTDKEHQNKYLLLKEYYPSRIKAELVELPKKHQDIIKQRVKKQLIENYWHIFRACM